MDKEFTWTSQSIDISAGRSHVTLDLSSAPTKQLEDSDMVTVFYQLDGGDIIQAAKFIGQSTPIGDDWRTIVIPDLIGTSLSISVTMINSSGTEKFYLDNVTVRQEVALNKRTIILHSSGGEAAVYHQEFEGIRIDDSYLFDSLDPTLDHFFSFMFQVNS